MTYNLIQKLEMLFNKKYLYKISDLANLTGAKLTSLRSELSNIQHPQRCGIAKHIVLKKEISTIDGCKRYGVVDAVKIYIKD